MSGKSFVAVAGATGRLGRLIVTNLAGRNVAVKALVRPNTDPARTAPLRGAGAVVAETNLDDVSALARELRGATAVVSALNGLADVMLGTQGALLDAAAAAGTVRRFVPSDFSLDFTKTRPGANRNLDLRREFHARLDASGLPWTSVLNGAFMEMLDGPAPLILHPLRRVLYWGGGGDDAQPLDFTTYADAAAFAAALAADPRPAPRYLRVAGDAVTARGLAAAVGRARGAAYSTQWVGSTGSLESASRVMRRFGIGGSEGDVFPAWQGMQYMVDMYSGAGKCEPLDNDRYPDLTWTKVESFLAKKGIS